MGAVKNSLLADRHGPGGRTPPSYVDQNLWAKCPTLNAYRMRVGAEIVNFRKAVVRSEDRCGYFRDGPTIRIQSDGQVECTSSLPQPTDAERATIAKEVTAANFPRSISAPKHSLPNQLRNVDKSHYFVFYDEREQNILFIQWRRDGKKPDLPFSYWSDGEWKLMEPDGGLPIYGLEHTRTATVIWIHEGAKAARDVQALVDEAGARTIGHPWGDHLKYATHLGWPGGALNAHRVDWEPIRELGPNVRVVVICDNDRVGIEAARMISSQLRRSLEVILFDDRFPPGFDLADAWPRRDDWWRGERYVGPSYEDLVTPATWATTVTRSEGKGRPSYKIRTEFAEEWLWTPAPKAFIHKGQPHLLRTEDALDTLVRPFSDAEKTARLLLRNLASRCDGIRYAPGEPRIISADRHRHANVYRPSRVKPCAGDPTPFVEFLTHLVPNEADRCELMRWCATLISRPDIRMSYGVLMVSNAQGVGKTTLGEAILAPLVGEWNVSYPSEQQITESQFNSWLAQKRLAIVNEIYSGHSVKAYNRLKSVITDHNVTVNEKYLPQYTLENWVHVYACSNSTRALHLDDEDRRWLVPGVTSAPQPPAYWTHLHEWLRGGGLGIIANWAKDFLNDHKPVLRGEHAPMTAAKRLLIAESRSEGQAIAFDLATRMVTRKDKVVLAVEAVRDHVARRRGLQRGDTKLERALTLRKALIAGGLQEPPSQPGKDTRFQIAPTLKSHVVANFPIEAGAEWPTLREFYRKPEELEDM